MHKKINEENILKSQFIKGIKTKEINLINYINSK